MLADFAKQLLDASAKAHDVVAEITTSSVQSILTCRYETALVKELARRLPLPFDAEVTAMARALQVTGVLICVSNGRELARCYCFQDLALKESKEQVQTLLERATEDWVSLASPSR